MRTNIFVKTVQKSDKKQRRFPFDEKYPYRYELHCHTGEFGWCAKVPAAKIVKDYAEAGFQGICISNHYFGLTFDKMPEKSWEGKINNYLRGYRAAKKAAEQFGMDIILSMELRFDHINENDYLVYGIDEDFLVNYPKLYLHTPLSFKRFADEHGLTVIQAHPFRSWCTPSEPEFVHGYEVINACERHQNNNEMAERLKNSSGLIGTAGSDYHQPKDLGRTGMDFKYRIKNSLEMSFALREEDENGEPIYKLLRP